MSYFMLEYLIKLIKRLHRSSMFPIIDTLINKLYISPHALKGFTPHITSFYPQIWRPD